MDLLSLSYIGFVLAALLCYYALPHIVPRLRRYQWVILLLASLSFYAWNGGKSLIFILFTSLSIWLCALRIAALEAQYKEKKRDKSLDRAAKKALKASVKNRQRIWLLAGLLSNFGILAWLKYWNVIFHTGIGLLLPLGISFYTFQSTAYLIDIYGAKYAPERSYPHFLLFVSWFPQLLQGPINRFDKMAGSLTAEHRFDAAEAERACWLILFGLMKKYAVADMLSSHISSVFDGTLSDVPGCLIVFTILLYSVQQYADFSGGIDIVMGVSRLFGVPMMPNFRQPYFSVSLGDFWRRWHISLGAWMRDYLFYPFALLKPMQNFGKWCTHHLGKHFGRVLPAGIANILVFFVVGIWHGAQLHYVFWGLYNGIVIALSDLTEPFWKSLSKKLHLHTQVRGFHIFRIVRTFIIVNIGWYFDRIYSAREELTAFANTIFRFQPAVFGMAFRNKFITNGGGTFMALGSMAVALAGTVFIFMVSLRRERGTDVEAQVCAQPFWVRGATAFIPVMLILVSFVFVQNAGGFMYANF